MQIAKDLAGFSPAQADDLRKAIGKKNAELMATLKDEFLEGCVGNGVERKVAEHLWAENERSADYSFNKAHAACYALIAYRTAYLKANHPAEYMAALISSVMDTKDRVPFYVQECAEMGIDVLPPDVNASDRDFAVRDGKIRFGLSAVKNVGDNAVRAIIQAREEGGPFHSVWDFCERVDWQHVTARVLESLIRAGALDSTGRPAQGHDRGARPGRGPRAQAAGRPQRRPGEPLREPHGRRRGGRAAHAPAGAGRRVGTARAAVVRARDARPVPLQPSARRRAGEAAPAHRLRALGLAGRNDGETVTIGGLIGSIRQPTTKKGDPMAFVQLEDQTGGCEVVVFSNAFPQARGALDVDRIVVVKGRVDMKTDTAKLVAFEVHSFDEVPDIGIVRVAIDARTVPATALDSLRQLVRDFPGDTPVVVDLTTSRGARRLRLGSDYRVRAEPQFFAEVRALIGDATLV